MEPSSRQAAPPQVLPEFIGRRGGVGGRRAEASWAGPFPSEMTDAFPQLQTSASAHSGRQRPCRFRRGSRREVSHGSPPSGPSQCQGLQRGRGGTETGNGPRRQRHRDTETDGERQRCMDTEEVRNQESGRKAEKDTQRPRQKEARENTWGENTVSGMARQRERGRER